MTARLNCPVCVRVDACVPSGAGSWSCLHCQAAGDITLYTTLRLIGHARSGAARWETIRQGCAEHNLQLPATAARSRAGTIAASQVVSAFELSSCPLCAQGLLQLTSDRWACETCRAYGNAVALAALLALVAREAGNDDPRGLRRIRILALAVREAAKELGFATGTAAD